MLLQSKNARVRNPTRFKLYFRFQAQCWRSAVTMRLARAVWQKVLNIRSDWNGKRSLVANSSPPILIYASIHATLSHLVLEYEKLYLENLPDAECYEKSYMHRDLVTHVVVTKTDFIVTASVDGHLKFWKKMEDGIEFVKHFRSHLCTYFILLRKQLLLWSMAHFICLFFERRQNYRHHQCIGNECERDISLYGIER